MGIQSNINSALGTLRVLGALNSGKKYIDKKVQRGTESVKEAAKGVGESVKGAVSDVGESVKEAAKGIEEKIHTWTDKNGNEMFGQEISPEDQEMMEEMQREQEEQWRQDQEAYRLASAYRARVAYDAVSDKLISKQNARDRVSNMKGILKGDINVNNLLQMDQSQIGKQPKIEENNSNGGAN